MRKLIIIFCITTIIACEKNETEKNETRSDYIVIGNSSNIDVEILNLKTQGEEYNIVSSSIDIDNDGFNDFDLYHYRQDQVDASFVTLKCVNDDSYVNTKNLLDTTYHQFHIDSIEYDDEYDIILMQIFNCNKDNPYGYTQFDSIYEIKSKSYIKPLATGDSISKQESWVSDSLLLSLSDRFYWGGGCITIDSSITCTKEILNCHLFPNDIEKYIGIKKGDRLGWIKISIHNNCETIIHEIGLQE